jgi:hypothetical protein
MNTQPKSPRLRRRNAQAVAFAFGTLTLATFAARANASDWTYAFTPYAWATDVSADVSIDDRQIADVEIDIDDLVDKVDLTTQFRFEAKNGRHGLATDLFFVRLEDDEKSVELPGVPVPAIAQGELSLTILDLAGTYNQRGDGEGFTLLYGARLVDRNLEIDAAIPVAPGVAVERSFEVSETLVDALVGAKFAGHATERLTYELRGSVSSGGTELTWDGFAGLGYAFDAAGKYTLVAGYRYASIEFEKNDAAPGDVDATVTLSGFVAGMKFTF